MYAFAHLVGKPLPPEPKRPLCVRSQEEVAAEIAKLRRLGPQLPKRDQWGNSHRRAVAVQILALRQKWDAEELLGQRERDPDDHNGAVTTNEFEEARDAIMWRENESNFAPSSRWLRIIAKQKQP